MLRKNLLIFFTMFCLVEAIPAYSQTGSSATHSFRKELNIFMDKLRIVPLDVSILLPISRHTETALLDIYTEIDENNELRSLEREKAMRSLVFLVKEFTRNLEKGKLEIYDIPGTVQTYKSVLNAMLARRPLLPFLLSISPQRSQLIAEAFSQYKEFPLLDDVMVYKRVAASPEFILQFLEHKPSFRFKDSLLQVAAAYDPLKLVYHSNRKESLKENLRAHPNIYVQQVERLSEDKHASELLPFLKQIAENKLSTEEIIKSRAEVMTYFQLLVNTLQASLAEGEINSPFLKPLRAGIKQKALAFYVNEINELHDSPASRRFASVNGLRPEDLYYIITSCGEELYTSSYLGLYKRLKTHFPSGNLDSLVELVQHDNLRTFIRMAANYNVLGDFLHSLSQEKMKQVMEEFVSGIEKDDKTALERAMDVADAFTAAAVDEDVDLLVRDELGAGIDRALYSKHYLGLRLYSILTEVYTLVKEKEGEGRIWTKLGDYKTLKRERIANDKGEIVELVLFYGDEDGKASYNNFLKLFHDRSKWELSKNEHWVSIRSLSGQPLLIFANLPLDMSEELDLRAQDSLVAFLEQQGLEPTVIVHRGHSYHLDKTLKRLKPSMRLAVLGSCGSYNKAISIANINPDVQVIGSKKTGSKSINDPILDVINSALIVNDQLNWPEIWDQLSKRFRKDESLTELFNEYFPPSKNLSLFVLKLFKSNR